MKTLLKLEELGGIIISIIIFLQIDYNWWLYPLLILTPDISMLGYLISDKFGAICYNIFHHKLVGAILAGIGLFSSPILLLIGSIIFGHACLDRLFGYGLKYNKGFKYTHLGVIGKK